MASTLQSLKLNLVIKIFKWLTTTYSFIFPLHMTSTISIKLHQASYGKIYEIQKHLTWTVDVCG